MLGTTHWAALSISFGAFCSLLQACGAERMPATLDKDGRKLGQRKQVFWKILEFTRVRGDFAGVAKQIGQKIRSALLGTASVLLGTAPAIISWPSHYLMSIEVFYLFQHRSTTRRYTYFTTSAAFH